MAAAPWERKLARLGSVEWRWENRDRRRARGLSETSSGLRGQAPGRAGDGLCRLGSWLGDRLWRGVPGRVQLTWSCSSSRKPRVVCGGQVSRGSTQRKGLPIPELPRTARSACWWDCGRKGRSWEYGKTGRDEGGRKGGERRMGTEVNCPPIRAAPSPPRNRLLVVVPLPLGFVSRCSEAAWVTWELVYSGSCVTAALNWPLIQMPAST